MSPPLPTGPGRAPWRGLALPFLLTWLPVAILAWQAWRFAPLLEARGERDMAQTGAGLGRVLARASDGAFWAEELARRLRTRLGTRLRRQGWTAALAGAMRRPLLVGVPAPQVWAVLFDPAHGGKPALARVPGLRSDQGFLFSHLLRETVDLALDRPSALRGPVWRQRIPLFFGALTTQAQFERPARGRAFPARLGQQHGFLAWDWFGPEAEPAGAFLLFLPAGGADRQTWLKATLLNWHRRDFLPAFLALPDHSGPRRGPRLIHPGLFREVPHRILEDLDGLMQITPSTRTAPDRVGRVDLPSSLAGRLVPESGWRFQVCPLAPTSGFLGVLLHPPGPAPENPFRAWTFTLAMLVGLGWAALLLRAVLGNGWPGLGLHASLLGWFAGLAAPPLLLSLGAGVHFLLHHEENLTRQLVEGLESTQRRIERESTDLTRRQAMLGQRLLDRPGLGLALDAVYEGRLASSSVLDGLWREACREGFSPAMIQIVGSQGFHIEMTASEVSPTLRQLLVDMYWRFLEPRLQPSPLPTSRPKLPLTSPSATLMAIQKQFPGLGNARFAFHETAVMSMGDIHMSSWGAPLLRPGSASYNLVVIWNQAEVIDHYLGMVLAERIRLADTDHRVGAFRQTGVTMTAVGTPLPGPALPFARLARAAREGTILVAGRRDGHPQAVLARPSLDLRGVVLIGMASLEPIRQAVEREGRLLAGVLAGLWLMVTAAAFLLSRWLAGPLADMSAGLGRVADGCLDTRFPDERPDELGQAGRTLNDMTAALRERQLIRRFVAPQVLTLVAGAGADAGQVRQGRKQAVAVLASDIRGFTTLSESQAPTALFAALNRHLAAMAGCIQAHDGIVERFIGDAVVAVFYPGRPEDPVRRAVAAARAMMAAQAAAQTERQARGEFTFAIGIGIELGTVVSGLLGDPRVRLDLGVVGEVVARAAELESRSRQGRASRIVVSGLVRNRLPPDQAAAAQALPGDDDAWELPDLATPSPAATTTLPRETPSARTGPLPPRMAAPDHRSEHRHEALPGDSPATTPGQPSTWPGRTGAPSVASPTGDSLAPDGETAKTSATPIPTSDAMTAGPAPASPSPVPGEPGEPGRDIPSSGQPSSPRAGWGVGWMAVVLWLLPVLLVGGVVARSIRTVVDRQGQVAMQTLEEAVGDLEPRLGVEIDLQSLLPGLVKEALTEAATGAASRPPPTGGQEAASTRNLQRFAAGFSRRITGLGSAAASLEWAIAGFPWPGTTTVQLLLATEDPDELIWDPGRPTPSFASGTRPWKHTGLLLSPDGIVPIARNGFPEGNLGPLPLFALTAKHAVYRYLTGMAPVRDIRYERYLRSTFFPAEQTQMDRTRFFPSSMYQVLPSAVTGVHRIHTFRPVFRQELRSGLPFDRSTFRGWVEADRRAPGDRRAVRRFQEDLRGTLHVAVRPDRAWFVGVVDRRRQEAARHGLKLALVPAAGPTSAAGDAPPPFAATDWADPSFAAEPLRSALSLDFSGPRRFGDWLVWKSSPRRFWPGLGRLVLAMPCGQDAAGRWWGVFAAATAGWCWFGWWWAWGTRPTLRLGLVLTFLTVLAPPALMGIMVMERARIEAEARLEAEGRHRLARAIDAFDQGFSLWRGYAHQILAGMAERSPLRTLSTWRRNDPRVIRELGRMAERAIRLGINLNNFGLSGPGLPPVEVAKNPDQKDHSENGIKNLLGRFLDSTLWPGSAGDVKGKGKGKGSDLLVETELEELRLTLGSVLGQEGLAMHFQRPSALDNWMLGSTRSESAFRTLLFGPASQPRNLYLMWRIPNLERHHFQSLANLPPRWRDPDLDIDVSPEDLPGLVLVPPFYQFECGGRGWPGRTPFATRPLAPWAARLNELVAWTEEPAGITRRAPGGLQLVRSAPGRTMAIWRFQGRLSLDRALGETAWQITWQRLFLLVLAGLVVLLARLTARRYLEPMERVDGACRAVTDGDFTVSLPADWTHEFGVLARAFNQVVREAREGRLLGRFVPEALRAVAHDPAREAAARAGEARRAVILFATVPGFKDVLGRDDPRRVVEVLNAHLQAMSHLVRSHGGEIDKFIGDKILAVFHGDAGGDGLAGAARAARAAATEMVRARAAAAATDGLGRALGVGITAGPVLVGILGAPTVRLEFTVIGDTVNLASRLADLAAKEPEGGILVDQGVADLDPAGLERLPAAPIKGKSREVALYRG